MEQDQVRDLLRRRLLSRSSALAQHPEVAQEEQEVRDVDTLTSMRTLGPCTE